MLEIRKLTIEFGDGPHATRAVDDVSLAIGAGAVVGLVGESGSGKTTLGLAVTRLLAASARIVSGQIMFEGRDLLTCDAASLRRVRGGRIAYVFQEPSTSLNPVMTVGAQVIEAIELHTEVRGISALARAVDLLGTVGIPSPRERLQTYPHELSGGMKQRVMIAMAIASGPALLIADEPTTALDVTLERQIIRLLARLQQELGLALLLITHNIHLVSQLAGRVAVMSQGRVVEDGPAERILRAPQHEYTRRLLAAQPKVSVLEER